MSKNIDNYKQPMEITRLKEELNKKEKKSKDLKNKLLEAYKLKDWKLVEEIIEMIN